MSDDNTVDLNMLIGTFVDSMRLLDIIVKEQTLTADTLVQCELTTSQFKKDFGEELLRTYH